MFQQSKNSIFIVLGALVLGILTGLSGVAFLYNTAQGIAELFIKFLQLISMPIIFLAITSTLTGMKSMGETKYLGTKTLKYTLLTTFIAATIAWLVYMVIKPIDVELASQATQIDGFKNDYLTALLQMFPNNIINAFSENNVIGVALIAFILGFASLHLPKENQVTIHELFNSLFQVFLQVAKVILITLPIGIWAFMTLFVQEIQNNTADIKALSLFITTILAANLIQAFVVLPLILKYKGISPLYAFKSVSPALVTAFFSKSSSATLPLTIDCITKDKQVSEKVAKFSLPMCSIINMNGCSAFILITVLFVASSAGVEFTLMDTILWIFIATIAAVGNASIPMGCYFLASAFLTSMNVPLHLMGIILTVYVFIDMVETTLNVWSDTVVTRIIDKEVTQ